MLASRGPSVVELCASGIYARSARFLPYSLDSLDCFLYGGVCPAGSGARKRDMSRIDRSEASRLLAKSIAYADCGKLMLAAEYARKLNEFLLASIDDES